MKNTGKIATGILIGAIAGAALGMLFAPKRGAKTRAVLADKARELGTAVKNNYSKVKDTLGMNKRTLTEKMIG
ncbi:MAG: YtxH domain-containing protein [Cyclobacteriaceae bacterium]|jgi:gas vesicle protein|nr:YtxH domain-containing protein [Cyclobacteriaceae bacterium]